MFINKTIKRRQYSRAIRKSHETFTSLNLFLRILIFSTKFLTSLSYIKKRIRNLWSESWTKINLQSILLIMNNNKIYRNLFPKALKVTFNKIPFLKQLKKSFTKLLKRFKTKRMMKNLSKIFTFSFSMKNPRATVKLQQ